MVVLNDLDRFHLVMDVIERVPKLANIGAHANRKCAINCLSTDIIFVECATMYRK